MPRLQRRLTHGRKLTSGVNCRVVWRRSCCTSISPAPTVESSGGSACSPASIIVARVEREDEAPNWRLSSWEELYLAGEVDAKLRRPLPRARPPDKVRPGWWAGFV